MDNVPSFLFIGGASLNGELMEIHKTSIQFFSKRRRFEWRNVPSFLFIEGLIFSLKVLLKSLATAQQI